MLARLAVFFLLALPGATTAFSQPLPICQGSALRDGAVYVSTTLNRQHCWMMLTRIFGGEGLRADIANLNGLPFSRLSKFVYVRLWSPLPTADNAQSAVVVKERVFDIAKGVNGSISANTAADPTQTVLLDRPAVNTRCANTDSLDYLKASRGASHAAEDLDRYNYFHSDPRAPISGDLIPFHFKYPISGNGCRQTQDAQVQNRQQYVIERLGSAPAPRGLFARLQFAAPVQAAQNKFDLKIEVRNLPWRASDLNNISKVITSARDGRALEFTTRNLSGTRLELTVADLEDRNGLFPRPMTWQLQWGE